MLKQGTFINKKFNRLLLGNIWGLIAACINYMADSLISGNQLGEVSLQAVTIIFPLFSVVYFFSHLISPGASVLFGKHIGEFKQEEAYRSAGTSFVSSILISIFLAAGMWLIKIPFLTYFGCSGELLMEASAYYNWLVLYALLYPILASVYFLTVTDGESVVLSVASITEILANVILSVVLSGVYGIAGLGMATCIGCGFKLICYIGHFMKKSNNIKFRFCLDLKIVKDSIVLSFYNYMYYLFLAIVDVVLNKIIITNCGMEFIPAYSVVNLIFGFCGLYESLNMASVGMVTCFLGEKNNHDMQLIFSKITKSTLIMTVGITVFFFFGAPLMPIVYGLETPTTINATITASRIMAFTALGFGACYLGGCISCAVAKPFQACIFSLLNDVLSPLLLSLIFGLLWGFTGIVIGMCLSTYFAFGLYVLLTVPKRGWKGFPIYVEDFGEDGFSYDIRVTSQSVTELRDAVSKELTSHGYEVKNIDLLMEEFFTRVMEKNPNKAVLAECTLLFGADKVRIIIRDDGALFNFVDENNNVESLNAHVLNSLLEQTKEKNYVLTTSFNRNGFVFEK